MGWIIVNSADDRFYFSETYGWVTDGYDTFSDDEMETMKLPANGVWEEVGCDVEEEHDDRFDDADALASAGFGTDEDYGCFNSGDDY